MAGGSRARNEGNGKDVVDMGSFGRGKVENAWIAEVLIQKVVMNARGNRNKARPRCLCSILTII